MKQCDGWPKVGCTNDAPNTILGYELCDECARAFLEPEQISEVNDLTAPITLAPTESGYRAYVGGEHIGYLMLRIWEGDKQVKNGCLASPAAIDKPSQRFAGIGRALDYLVGIYLRRAVS